MIATQTTIHSTNGKVPEVQITNFDTFSTIGINFGENSVVRIFLQSSQDVTKFKNNFLRAFKSPKIA
jgi:hypothetical protein